MARRPGPSLRALLFWCGDGAVCEAWRLEDRGRGPQARSVPQAKAPFLRLGSWKTAQTAGFLVGSESDVRHWGPLPAGPVRPSGPCCFAVARAPFVSLVAAG